MVRFGVAIAALACMAVPALAQESTEQLKKELQELRAEVDGLKAVNQTKEIPAQGKIDADAMAGDGDNPLMTLLKSTKLSGFVDAGYEFSFNTLNSNRGGALIPPALLNTHNQTRLIDNRDNSFYLNEAHVQLERRATKDMIVGYRIALALGHDPSIYDGNSVALQEGWAEILAPVGSGIDIKVGKMASLVGYEYLTNVNNMNYSRGMLWSFVDTKTATGVRASYGMGGSNNDMVTFTVGFNNGLNAVRATGTDTFADADHGKAVEFQVAVMPTRDVTLRATLITGNDTASGVNVTTADKFYSFDIVAQYTMDKLTVAANVNWSSAQQTDLVAPINNTRSPVSGFAVYAKYAWTDAMATAARYEYFSDTRGTVFVDTTEGGPGVRVAAITLTQEIKVANQLIVRIEVRHDDANDHIFRRNEKAARGDNTLGFEVIMPF